MQKLQAPQNKKRRHVPAFLLNGGGIRYGQTIFSTTRAPSDGLTPVFI